jgi:SAM-dependent methyltransferase
MQLTQKIGYAVSGLSGRIGARAVCPACKSEHGRRVDRKWFHSLIECDTCGLLHRYPIETAGQMAAFYNDGYAEPGLTTELPSPAELSALLASGFKGSIKDFSYHGNVIEAFGVPAKGRLLDFGANWGYASWQFARRGFNVTSYEISQPKAAFGANLGVTIHTDLASVGSGFDAVYSSHVLEHTPDPREVLMQQLALVKPGGLVIAHTPNGSSSWRAAAGRGFSPVWGFVHPVLLTDRFVAHVAGPRPYFVSSNDRPENVSQWDRMSQLAQSTAEPGFVFAIRRPL